MWEQSASLSRLECKFMLSIAIVSRRMWFTDDLFPSFYESTERIALCGLWAREQARNKFKNRWSRIVRDFHYRLRLSRDDMGKREKTQSETLHNFYKSAKAFLRWNLINFDCFSGWIEISFNCRRSFVHLIWTPSRRRSGAKCIKEWNVRVDSSRRQEAMGERNWFQYENDQSARSTVKRVENSLQLEKVYLTVVHRLFNTSNCHKSQASLAYLWWTMDNLSWLDALDCELNAEHSWKWRQQRRENFKI